MVRVISQNFSPPRSRHSSGETDRDLAERTKLALSSLGPSLGAIGGASVECESSSDSFWDSEFDGEQTLDSKCDIQDINGNGSSEKSNVQTKRKDRRRERNKISAQAYRKRRRHESSKQQEVLQSLESENRRLHKLVDTLEKKKEHARQYIRGCSVPMPDVLSSAVEGSDIVNKELCPLNPVPEVPEECASDETATDIFTNQTNVPVTPISRDMQSSCNQLQTSLQTSELMLPLSANVNTNSMLNNIDSVDSNVNASVSKSNVSKFNLFPAHILTTDPLSNSTQLSQNPQILLQTHTLIGASASPQNGANFPTCAIPAYVAVPVENSAQYFSNANFNLNLPITPSPTNVPLLTEKAIDKSHVEAKCINDNSASVNPVTQMMNGSTSNHNLPSVLRGNSLVSFVETEMCNNNNNNGNYYRLNSEDNCNKHDCDNGNKNLCKTFSSYPTGNLNANHAHLSTASEIVNSNESKQNGHLQHHIPKHNL